MSVFLTEIGDVRVGGLEDPQPEQAEQGDKAKFVTFVESAGGKDRLKLQMGQPEGG